MTGHEAAETPALTIALAQYAIDASPERTLHTVQQLCAPVTQAELFVLPEVGLGRWLNATDVPEGTEASQGAMAAALARQLGADIVTSVQDQTYNRWIWVGADGQRYAQYDKIHLFTPLNEHQRFGRGDRVVTWDWARGAARVGAAVCYDLRFGEQFAAMRQRGAELIIVPARWPIQRLHHWQSLLRARAIEFQCWVIGVNAVGPDPARDSLIYGGGSMAIDPTGEIVVQLGQETAVQSFVFDSERVRRHRREFPVWQDRQLGPL